MPRTRILKGPDGRDARVLPRDRPEVLVRRRLRGGAEKERAPHRELVYALFRQYRSCPRLAEVLREEHGIEVGLRAVQKFVEPLRETLRREDELYLQKRAERELAAANATIRANEREELRRMRELARSQACLSAAAVQAGDEVSLTREIIGTLPAAVYEEPARRTRRRTLVGSGMRRSHEDD